MSIKVTNNTPRVSQPYSGEETAGNSTGIDEILKNFNFSALFEDEEEGGLMKFVPLVSLVFEVIIVIMLFLKK